MRNMPLARALHSRASSATVIPVELFRAVAEVLATVYATKRRKGGSCPRSVPPARRPASGHFATDGHRPIRSSL